MSAPVFVNNMIRLGNTYSVYQASSPYIMRNQMIIPTFSYRKLYGNCRVITFFKITNAVVINIDGYSIII